MKKIIFGIILSIVLTSCGPVTGTGFTLLIDNYDGTPYAINYSDDVYVFASEKPLTVTIHNGYWGFHKKTIQCSVNLTGVNKDAFKIDTSWKNKKVYIQSEKEAKFDVYPVTGLPAGTYYATVTVTDHTITEEKDIGRWQAFVVRYVVE
jgi:hypothetical protein